MRGASVRIRPPASNLPDDFETPLEKLQRSWREGSAGVSLSAEQWAEAEACALDQELFFLRMMQPPFSSKTDDS